MMRGEQAQARKIWQTWQLLLLCLAVAWAAAAAACGLAGFSASVRGAAEEPEPLPILENSTLGAEGAVREEAHRYYDEARRLALQGKWAEAIVNYDQAIVVAPSSKAAYLGIGDAYRAMGEFEESVRAYSGAIALEFDGWRAYYYRGASYFSLRHFQRALEDFERVIAIQPHIADAYFARGTLLWLGGRCAAALADFQTFIALADEGERLAQGRGYIDDLKSAAQCEPPPDILLLVSAQGTASGALGIK